MLPYSSYSLYICTYIDVDAYVYTYIYTYIFVLFVFLGGGGGGGGGCGRVPKVWGTFLGVTVVRIVVYWDPYWGPPPNFEKLPFTRISPQ